MISVAGAPDFAVTDARRLDDRDLRFILEQFPRPGRSYDEIVRIIDGIPTTVESMLSSDYLFDKVCERTQLLLDVSPFLLFSILLRRTLRDQRSAIDRRLIAYLANLLALFVRTERVHRVDPSETKTYSHIVDLWEEAQRADARRRFLIHSHVGNYTLFLTGLFPRWVQQRSRFGRRPVGSKDYVDFGRTGFAEASAHPLARELRLDDVFLRLALMFDHYRLALNRMAETYLFPA
jgi:hypothetical protein